jgi:EmrB/QacA subfamily drug resistance transporter
MAKTISSKTRTALIVAVLCTAQLMLIVDVVVVNVAIPSLRADLDVTPSLLQLTGVAYTVTLGSLLIVVGRAGDLFGRRRVFLIGVVIFTVMSAACGVAQEGWQLFVARALQGVGAALISPNALALLVGSFPEERVRHRVLGIWAAILSAGAMAGQLLGGLITETVGWRGIFLVNVPVGVLVLWLARSFVPAMAPVKGGRLDLMGAIMLAATLGGTSVLLAQAGGGASIVTVFGIVIVFGLLAAFLLAERQAAEPVLPKRLLRLRKVVVANVILALNAGAVAAALYFSTLAMQTEMGYGPLETGLGFAPITGIVLAVSTKAGWLLDRVGARTLLVAGAMCGVIGLVALSLSGAGDSYWSAILPGLSFVALGSGLSYAPTLSLATGVSDQDQGAASGLVNTSQEVGTATGLAALAPIAAAAAAGGLLNFTVGYMAGAVVAALAGIVALAAPTRDRRDRDGGGSTASPDHDRPATADARAGGGESVP